MTEQEYWEKVEFLEAQNPDEILLNRLKDSYSKANYSIYLPFALNRIPDEVEEVIVLKTYVISPNEEDLLRRQYGVAYGDACKSSNKLHEYKRNPVPISLIDEILGKQEEMDVIAKKLDGTYKEEVEKEVVELEGEAKMKKILSLRASISRKQRELNNLIGSDENEKIQKCETQLFNYKIELQKLESKDL